MSPKNQSKKPNPFVFRAGETDLGRHVPTCFDRPAPVTEEVDLDPRRSGTGNRVAAATKADIRRSPIKQRDEGPRPEQNDHLVTLGVAHGVWSKDLCMPRRCFELALRIASLFGNFSADGSEILDPSRGNDLRKALERSSVRPHAGQDREHYDALIEFLAQGQGLKIKGYRNSRDSHLSVANESRRSRSDKEENHAD